MPIPRIIHSVWLGGDDKKSALVRKCEASWRKHLPDWTFMEWNETNFDFDSCPYARSLYDLKAWGFLSDPMRFKALKEHGGFYLDCDMLLLKPLDPFLGAKLVMGFMLDCALETAIIGAEKENSIITDLCNFYFAYDGNPIISNSPVTWYFLDHVKGFKLTGENQSLGDGVQIYGRKYFGSPTYNPRKGFAIHLAMGSWLSVEGVKGHQERISPWSKKMLYRLVGPVFYADIHQKYMLSKNREFYPTYRLHKKGISRCVYPMSAESELVLSLLKNVAAK